MKKPGADDFDEFDASSSKASNKAGKKQYLVPYFIASHPGSALDSMIDLAVFLKRNHYQPDQVQDFIPSPFDIAACMYHTGLDPFTKKPVYIAKHLRDRKLQRALMQFFKPENYFEVRKALEQAGRQDLIGDGCDCSDSEPAAQGSARPPPRDRPTSSCASTAKATTSARKSAKATAPAAQPPRVASEAKTERLVASNLVVYRDSER